MPDLHYGHSVLNVETTKLSWPLDDGECSFREHVKHEASKRLPEIADELKRRVFHDVELIVWGDLPRRIHAHIGAFTVTVMPNVNHERPYTIRAEMNTPEKWLALLSGREVTFEGVLQVVDDLLAGFKAGQQATR